MGTNSITFNELYKGIQEHQHLKNFKFSESVVKQRLEELIAREYCVRDEKDRKVYHYIAWWDHKVIYHFLSVKLEKKHEGLSKPSFHFKCSSTSRFFPRLISESSSNCLNYPNSSWLIFSSDTFKSTFSLFSCYCSINETIEPSHPSVSSFFMGVMMGRSYRWLWG